MRPALSVSLAALIAVTLIVGGVWLWQSAAAVVVTRAATTRPWVLAWGVRAAGGAVVAAGEWVAVAGVAGRLGPPRRVDAVLRAAAALAVAAGLGAAVFWTAAARWGG